MYTTRTVRALSGSGNSRQCMCLGVGTTCSLTTTGCTVWEGLVTPSRCLTCWLSSGPYAQVRLCIYIVYIYSIATLVSKYRSAVALLVFRAESTPILVSHFRDVICWRVDIVVAYSQRHVCYCIATRAGLGSQLSHRQTDGQTGRPWPRPGQKKHEHMLIARVWWF